MKYGNKKVIVEGIKFDSKLEAGRYQELRILEWAGEITDLRLQQEFELIPSFRKNGKTYRKTVYKADFTYFDNRTGKNVVEDTKGYRTTVYKLKKKLFEYRYPDLTIKEVTK
jgi:hypothetical protein